MLSTNSLIISTFVEYAVNEGVPVIARKLFDSVLSTEDNNIHSVVGFRDVYSSRKSELFPGTIPYVRRLPNPSPTSKLQAPPNERYRSLKFFKK